MALRIWPLVAVAALVGCTPSKQEDTPSSSASSTGGNSAASSASNSSTGTSGTSGSDSSSGSSGSASTSSASSTSGSTGTVDRGPTQVAVAGDPNGLWWDAPSHTLYLADNENNVILRWTDARGLETVGALAAAPANGPGLGQLVITADGTLVVTRFGYGTAGDVSLLKPDGTASKVPHLDPARRRLGLTLASDGQLYDSYFTKVGTTVTAGVARLDIIAGTEVEVISGLSKPVGVLAVGTDLFVSDQTLGQILKAPQAHPDQYTVYTSNFTPDLLSAGPGGTLFTGGAGVVYEIDAAGAATTFAAGFQQPRGTAYDPEGRRLFIADHDPNHVHSYLQIVPVN